VSSVRDLSFMFLYATSFNQSFADWNISNETDMRGIFTGADSLVEVQVQVQHDNYPLETGWTLRDSSGISISSQCTGSITKPGSVTKTSSVALGTYIFEMTDTRNEGYSGNYGSGLFSIAVNGQTVVSNNGEFRDTVQETFEVQAPTPSRFWSLRLQKSSERPWIRTLSATARTRWSRAIMVGRLASGISQIQDFSYLFAAANFGDDKAGTLYVGNPVYIGDYGSFVGGAGGYGGSERFNPVVRGDMSNTQIHTGTAFVPGIDRVEIIVRQVAEVDVVDMRSESKSHEKARLLQAGRFGLASARGQTTSTKSPHVDFACFEIRNEQVETIPLSLVQCRDGLFIQLVHGVAILMKTSRNLPFDPYGYT
jgi:hypothetical protein